MNFYYIWLNELFHTDGGGGSSGGGVEDFEAAEHTAILHGNVIL